MDSLSLAVTVGAVWTAAVLVYQVLKVLVLLGKEHGPPAANPWRGVIYNLTAGASPGKKETARQHPFKFALGVVFHFGIVWAFVRAAAVSFSPYTTAISLPSAAVCAAGGVAGVILFTRRVAERAMRFMSTREDYFAVLATTTFLTLTAAEAAGIVGRPALAVTTTAFLIYLPLGKLKHVLFCPLARLELGWRLGRRGVLPPSR